MSAIGKISLMNSMMMRYDAQSRLMNTNQARIDMLGGANLDARMQSVFNHDKQLSMQSIKDKMLIQMAEAFEKNHREKTKKTEGFDTFA